MLTPDERIDLVRDLWKRHEDERVEHDRVYDYVRGKRGVPEVPDGSGDELEDIARMSVKNVLKIVVDAFAQNLAVNGFRSPTAEQDDPVWAWWQSQRLDARQSEAHRPAVTYGTAYAVLLGKGATCRLRTPRQMFAVYEDPSLDLWPEYALETWIDKSGPKPIRRGTLLDGERAYPVDLGAISRVAGGREDRVRRIQASVSEEEDPTEHGAEHCPVVRFVNSRDAEDVVVGEVAPLITEQRAISAVNFDRLVVSRFGAYPQKYAIGWAASSSDELARASAARLMAFDDPEIKVGSFAQAQIDPYNSILEEMVAHVATEAQVPLSSFGSLVNLSAEALAMAEAPHQRKLADKRESFGESWEQLLRLAAELNGFESSDAAEVLWRDTEVRSFAQVVDGISKLAAQGVPIEELLSDIPGWSKQRVDAVKAAIQREASDGATEPGGDSIKAKADAMGVLIRAGVEPEFAARQVGLAGVEFTGAVPTSLRLPTTEAAGLEQA